MLLPRCIRKDRPTSRTCLKALTEFSLLAFFLLMLLPLRGNAEDPVEVSYDGYKLISVEIASNDDITTLRDADAMLMQDGVGIGTFDYIVPPEALAIIGAAGIVYTILDSNVQDSIDAERNRMAAAVTVGPRAPIYPSDGPIVPYSDPPSVSWYEEYKTLSEINSRINAWEQDYPVLVTIEIVAQTEEGRSVKVVRISKGSGNKPALVILGGIHAREWISPMVTMYIGDMLIWGWDNDPAIHDLLTEFEVILVPAANPDGYVYTATDRFWRKNRHEYYIGGEYYYGTDLNRNWDNHWGTVGVSNDVTDDPNQIYCGEFPFSENETEGISDFIIANSNIIP